MAFGQNQQDAFNLRNDTESLKRLQIELDKATTSIGAAEAAAEEELAQQKLKNLTEQQKERLAQLDRLIAQEEAGIRELAALRLKLSEKQFELRKKEIQKELELAKKAADDLHKEQSQKPKDSPNAKKPSTTGVTKASSSKPTTAKEKGSSKANDSELINLVSSIDKTLGSLKNTVTAFTNSSTKPQTELTSLIGSINKTISSLHSSVTTFVQSKNAGLSSVPELPQQPISTVNDIQAATKPVSPEVILPKVKDNQQQDTDISEKSFIKDSEGKSPIELTTLVGSIDGTLTSLRDTVTTFVQNPNDASSVEITNLVHSIDATLESLYETVSGSTKNGKSKTKSQSVGTEAKTSTGAGGPPPDHEKPVEVKSEEPEGKDFTSNSNGLKEVDLGRYSFEAIKIGFDTLREQLSSSTINTLNKVVANKDKTSQTSIDFAGELLENFEAAEAAIRKVREFNENKELNTRLMRLSEEQQLIKKHAVASFDYIKTEAAALAKEQDILNNREVYEKEAVQKLSLEHINKENELRLAGIDAAAKTEDIINNRALYLFEERLALENAHINAKNTAELNRIAAAAQAEDLKNNRGFYLQEAFWKRQNAFTDEQNKLKQALIDAEADRDFQKDPANAAALNDLESDKLRLAHINAEGDAMKAQRAADAKARDLVNNRELYLLEEKRSLENAYAEKQNKLAEEQIQAEAKLDFVRHNKGLLLSQAEHELRIGHINAEHDAMQALINAQAKKDDLTNNRAQYLKEAAQNLEVGHVTKQNDLTQASINAEAKGKDLVDNRDQYEIEARMARENAFYDERNRQAEELIQLETELAWEKAHSDEILAQELQKKRLGYLKEYQEHQKKAGKYAVDQKEFEKDKARKDNKAAKKEASTGIIDGVKKLGTGEFSMTDIKKSYGEYMGQRTAELEESGMSESSAKLTAQFELLAEVSGNLAQQLSQTADKIGEKQAPIDTRLQGSHVNDTKFGSYWRQLAKDMNKVGAVNPYFKQEDFASNIETLVNKGISFDIKQRAFLMTIQEKIANTFEVADGTLLRLVRIQQEDTTAGRLGMESALNSFLNSMYETSEYLSDVASSVRSSLEEMQALMEGAAGTELEFQVQKWMGSLYSVGMSQEAVQGIAQAFGQIASGDVSGLTGSGTGNLLIMAANEAGKSIADILQEGLDAKETNELMQAMVNYLAEIAETSSDSRVVQQQLANVYGLKASDLKAATNLATSVKDVYSGHKFSELSYDGMLGQLKSMANSMILRTSQGEMLSNVWDNVQYTMGTQMASNPILYLLPKVATLLEDFAGGIDLPFLNVMGFGVDLNTSVAQLMNVASMSGTILGALGPMISGLASAVSGSAMLNLAGIDTKGKAPVIARGTGATLQNMSGASLSESGYIGNSSGEDVKKATLQDAADSKKKQMVEAKEEESSDDVVIKAQLAAVNIYNLLEEVAHGSQSLRVRVVNGGSLSTANSGAGGGYAGQSSTLGDSSGTSTTSPGFGAGATAGAAAGVTGADNGNWVLTF